MRRPSLLKTIIAVSFIIVVVYIFLLNNRIVRVPKVEQKVNVTPPSLPQVLPQKTADKTIIISFVVCDSRFNESLNVVKSVLLFTKTPVRFVIFTDENLKNKFEDTLKAWQKLARYRLSYELHDIKFPKAHEKDWLNLFSKCAAQRLFIPDLVPHTDAMIYVDTDTLFLGPADVLWEKFSEFNSSQISAMALEDDNPNVSWYPRFAKHPFYGKYGLNSGVMLMNLTRMRDFGWVEYVTPIMLKWKLYIPWGDQDIINIIFHYHGGAVRVLSCRHNYRPDQCMYGDACAPAAAGVSVLHASRRAAHNNKQPAFQAMYRAIDEYEIGGDPRQVVANMERYLAAAPDSYCGNMSGAFLKLPRQILTPDAMYRAIDEYEIGGDPRQVVANMERYLAAAPDSYCGNMSGAFLKLPRQILTPDAMYRAIDEYEIGGDPRQVVANMERYLAAAPDSYCGNMSGAFLKLPRQILTPDVR